MTYIICYISNPSIDTEIVMCSHIYLEWCHLLTKCHKKSTHLHRNSLASKVQMWLKYISFYFLSYHLCHNESLQISWQLCFLGIYKVVEWPEKSSQNYTKGNQISRMSTVCQWLFIQWHNFASHIQPIKFNKTNVPQHSVKLEQLERLRSDDTPTASWLPILLSHIGSQVKRRQSKSYKFKEFAKISFFYLFEFWNKHYTQHTILSGLIRCAKMKWIWQVLLETQSGYDSVYRRTDGQTNKVKPVFPLFNFVEEGGIIIWNYSNCTTAHKHQIILQYE